MPLSSITSLATLRAQARAFFRSAFPSRGVSDVQFLGKISNVVGAALFGVQRTLEAIDRDSPPSPKTSTLGLDSWAFAYGLPSNLGSYGRNGATISTGGIAPVTGTGGTVVPALAQLTAPDGVTILQINTGGVIPFSGAFSSVTTGTASNLPSGTALTWVSPPAGCDPTAILSSPLTGALDKETDAALFTRLLNFIQIPPKGGADIDYKTWAEEVSGVYKAYVYPKRSGTGTVDVVILAGGSGAGRVPSNGVLAAVQTLIAALQPTNVENANVFVPYTPSTANLSIKCRVVLSDKYSWDWNDSSTGSLISSYNAGTPSITLQAAAPAALQAAIASGTQPRIQVYCLAGGSPVVPETRRVVAIGGGNTILTLDSPLVFAPSNNDTIYAGSYATPLIGQSVLNYVDSVGPSRASGFASQVLLWEDTVSVFKLGEAADAFDIDGSTRLIKNVLIDGIVMKIGNGPQLAQDAQAHDDLLNAPQINVAIRILVTQ